MKDSVNNSIKCTVENCHYNNNNLCEAGCIEVNAMGDNVARTCEGTSCSTFKNEDGQSSI